MADIKYGLSIVIGDILADADKNPWGGRYHMRDLARDIGSMLLMFSPLHKSSPFFGKNIDKDIKSGLFHTYGSDVDINHTVKMIKETDGSTEKLKECMDLILSDKYDISEENQADFDKFINVLECIRDGKDDIEFPVIEGLSEKEKYDGWRIITKIGNHYFY